MNDSMTFSEIQSALRWIDDGNVRKIMIGEFTNLLVSLFRLRDCRDLEVGVGRRDEFYDAFLRLYATFPRTLAMCLPLIPVYGYWKDYMNILIYAKEHESLSADSYESLKDTIYDELVRVMFTDVFILEDKCRRNMGYFHNWSEMSTILNVVGLICSERRAEILGVGENVIHLTHRVSLCSKWMPRENGRADRIIGNVVRDISAKMFPNVSWGGERCRLYRKVCSIYTVIMRFADSGLVGHRRTFLNSLFATQKPSITTARRMCVSSPYSFDGNPIVDVVNDCVGRYIFQDDVLNTHLNVDSIYYEDWLERRGEYEDSGRDDNSEIPEPTTPANVDVVERYEITETQPTEKTLTERLLSVFWG